MIRAIISGGGTGGHIFPAIAIANALKAKVADMEILFIGAKGRMEMEKVPAAGFRIEGLTISGFQRRFTTKNLLFPFKLLASLLKARSIISKFNPDIVIGVGGYASGPTLRIAADRGIPCLIQEQNSFPGVTNRILGKKVQKICVAYDGMNKYFPKNKIVLTGNPIRRDVINIIGKAEEAYPYFGLAPRKKTILVIGGSLGAGTINQAILKFVNDLSTADSHYQDSSGIQLIWQTGKYYHEKLIANFPDYKYPEKPGGDQITNTGSESFKPVEMEDQITDAGTESLNPVEPEDGVINYVILPFIDRMDLAYAAADLIVSRAGAIAISELCVVGKPVILVPSPNVAEDHQMKNARFLFDRQATLLVSDRDAMEKLGPTIIDTLADESLQMTLKKNIADLGITDAADRIADEAMKLIKENE